MHFHLPYLSNLRKKMGLMQSSAILSKRLKGEGKEGEKEWCSVFPTGGFLRPGTQVRQFGRKLKALDAFFVLKLDAKL